MTTPVRERIDYWAGVAGRPLNRFEQMKIARPFRYNSVEKKLYKVLKPVVFGAIYGYVEIDINVRRGEDQFDFDLLIHNKSSDIRDDKFLSDIPVPERQYIEGLHGYEVTQWILYGDVWSQLDLNRLHYLNGRTMGIRRLRLVEVLQPGHFAEQLYHQGD
jgi:hypothetical protein